MPRPAGLDPTFGTGGEGTASFTNFINTPNDAALQPNGDIVVAGELEETGQTPRLVVQCYLGS